MSSGHVLREYERLAADYDRRWSAYIRATTQETLKRLPSAGGRLLDLGCGTGALLEAAAASFPGVALVGLDPVPAMLDRARRKPVGNARFVLGWAESLPFADSSFDIVACLNNLHYWRRPDAGLHEVLRVLHPGGLLVLTDWCRDHLTSRLCDLFLRAFNRAHHKAYGDGECREMLAAAGFTNIHIERYKIDWWWGMMTATCRKPGSQVASRLSSASACRRL